MYKRLWVIFVVLACSSAAYAQTAGVGGTSESDVVNMVSAAIQKSADSLLADCAKWLGLFMLVQFAATNAKLLTQADMDSALAKIVGSIMWFGFCWYIMDTGPGFIKAVGGQFWDKFAGNIPTPGTILSLSMALAGSLFGLASLVGGTIVGTVLAQGLMLIAFLVGGAGAFFAFKAFLLQVELAIIAMLSPLSFSMLGLNALRDQGISPFKSLIALVYRILLYGVLFGALLSMLDVVKGAIDHYTSLNWDTAKNIWHGGKDMLKAIMAALGGEFLLLMLLWKADTIASTLAGGSSSLGGADMAGAVAAGVAAGMGAHSASEAMMRPAQGMGDVMRGLMGRNGMDMRDASAQGVGGAGGLTELAKPDMGGSMSLDGASSADAGGAAGRSGAAGEAALPPNPNDFGGVPNPVASDKARDPIRDAARESRRQAKGGAGGNEPTISGSSGGGSDQAMKQIADALSKPRAKSLGERLGEANQHATQEKATTSVHINTHHE